MLTTRDMGEARARIGGLLVSLSVREGDMVRAGQTIGRVRDDRIGLQTSALSAQAAASAAEAARAQADLERTRDLFDKGVYAKARLDQVQAQAEAANASLEAARAQRNASAEAANQGAILAPATGRILVADVPVGSVVSPGQIIAKVTAGPPVIRIELPEADAGSLNAGDRVRLSPSDLDGVTEGTIAEIYPAVTGGQVRINVTAPRLPAFLIGKRVRAEIAIGQRRALVAPRRYISTRFGVDFARLVRADGSLAEISVQTAPGPDAESVEILSGLKPGDILSPSGADQ